MSSYKELRLDAINARLFNLPTMIELCQKGCQANSTEEEREAYNLLQESMYVSGDCNTVYATQEVLTWLETQGVRSVSVSSQGDRQFSVFFRNRIIPYPSTPAGVASCLKMLKANMSAIIAYQRTNKGSQDLDSQTKKSPLKISSWLAKAGL